MMTNDEIRAVLDADDAGKDIEYCDKDSRAWYPKKYMWNFTDLIYRVKPVEPRHIYISVWVNPDEIEKSSGFIGSAYTYQETKYNPEPAFQYIELTPEVRAILTEKGILKC